MGWVGLGDWCIGPQACYVIVASRAHSPLRTGNLASGSPQTVTPPTGTNMMTVQAQHPDAATMLSRVTFTERTLRSVVLAQVSCVQQKFLRYHPTG